MKDGKGGEDEEGGLRLSRLVYVLLTLCVCCFCFGV